MTVRAVGSTARKAVDKRIVRSRSGTKEKRQIPPGVHQTWWSRIVIPERRPMIHKFAVDFQQSRGKSDKGPYRIASIIIRLIDHMLRGKDTREENNTLHLQRLQGKEKAGRLCFVRALSHTVLRDAEIIAGRTLEELRAIHTPGPRKRSRIMIWWTAFAIVTLRRKRRSQSRV